MSMLPIDRRTFLTGLAATGAFTALSGVGRAAESSPGKRTERGGRSLGLAELKYRPLPLGAVEPEGWLRRQLQIQAQGLTGHLDEFWPDVGQSQWFGGKAEGWERAPYWLDGFIPLAWVLNDDTLKAKARKYVEHIVAAQRPDGWFAPYPADAKSKDYDLWSILLANKVLAQYHEATGDQRVLDAMVRNLKALTVSLDRKPLFKWGQFRWFEGLIPVYYVYEISGEPWLLDLARKLHRQGFDYRAYYQGADIKAPTARRGKWTFEKHVVNTAMALKAYALASRLTGSEDDRLFAREMFRVLDNYHGQVTGMFSGDECLSGRNPVQGTELCAVVEAMYSLEHLLAVTGEPEFGDRLERIAFNALPATFAPDMWSHQYDQQVNQVQCTINPEHMFSTNGPESNLYGLEPNFGCCTSNMHQGWPKFAAHLWMRAPGEGIAAMAYAPSSARFTARGVPVRVACDTDYPFRDKITLRVITDKSVEFPLVVRVPAWAKRASIRIAGGPEQSIASGMFHRLERAWKGTTFIHLEFPMKAAVSRRYNNSISVERGPLVYSLQPGEKWTRVNADKPHRELPHGDFEVRPTTAWNYGLLLDEANPEKSVSFAERPIGERPFSPEGAGVAARIKGRKVPGWGLKHGWAADTPRSPVKSSEPLEELTLIPYGCTNLRVTEFPKLES